MNNLRNIPKTIKFTSCELENIEIEAKRKCMDFSTYVRNCIFEKDNNNDYSVIARKVNNIVIEYNELVKANPLLDTTKLEYDINDTILELVKGGN